MIKLRGSDCWGCGYYQAPRGERKHNGIDLICHANEAIVAFEGGEVSKIGLPYSDPDKSHYRYVEITVDDGNRHRYFYTAPLVDVGDVIERGQIIGSSQTLTNTYPGMTQHCHFEVKKPNHAFTDPVSVLESLGYEVE